MKRNVFMARYYASLLAAEKEPGKHSWYRFEAKANDVVDIYVYDEIGYWGITASDFIRDLNTVSGKTINLRLNTPGGMVTDGHAMFNALVDHSAKVTTYNDALAASMGSVLALAGSEKFGGGGMKMAKNAMFMIHNPWGMAIGDAADMLKHSEVLSKMEGILADAYVEVTGKTKDEILLAMKDESWYTADEAVAMGFCTEITGKADNAKISSAVLALYENVPDSIKIAVEANAKAINDNLSDSVDDVPPNGDEVIAPYSIKNKLRHLELLEL